MWTENKSIAPFGSDTIDELLEDLQRMIDDVQMFKPVPFDALRVGMTFEKTEKEITKK